MDVAEYQGELTRAHWDLLLDADPHFDAVLAYTPPHHHCCGYILDFKTALNRHDNAHGVRLFRFANNENLCLTMLRRHGMASALIHYVV